MSDGGQEFRIWLSRKGERKRGVSWKTGFLADEPIDLGGDGKGFFCRPTAGWSDGGKENRFFGVPVADEWKGKYLMGEGKEEGRGGETWGEFPVGSRRQTRVSRIGGVDMPPRFRSKAEAEGEGAPGG